LKYINQNATKRLLEVIWYV